MPRRTQKPKLCFLQVSILELIQDERTINMVYSVALRAWFVLQKYYLLLPKKSFLSAAGYELFTPKDFSVIELFLTNGTTPPFIVSGSWGKVYLLFYLLLRVVRSSLL